MLNNIFRNVEDILLVKESPQPQGTKTWQPNPIPHRRTQKNYKPENQTV